jgi:hypothetical protein
MPSPDLSVFDRVKTKADFDRLNEEFQLKKQLALKGAQGSTPAALQIADAYAEARASGDIQRMNDIAIAAKSFDKGVGLDQNNNPVALYGYGDAVGSIAGTKKSYEANAQNSSDLQYDPLIAGGEAQQRQAQELNYAGPIADAKKTAEIGATQIGDLQKKADNANSASGLTGRAREILKTGKPTGSYLGAGYNFGKRVIGVSDETTQANSALDVIAGNITANVPRMEGPQSNADLDYYKQMAGRVADKTLPAKDRLSALDEIDFLNAKYSNIQTPTKAILSTTKLNPANIPMDAVMELRNDPSAAAEFDEAFGQGAARMVLGGK